MSSQDALIFASESCFGIMQLVEQSVQTPILVIEFHALQVKKLADPTKLRDCYLLRELGIWRSSTAAPGSQANLSCTPALRRATIQIIIDPRELKSNFCCR